MRTGMPARPDDAKQRENEAYDKMKEKHGNFFRQKYKPGDYALILDKDEQDKLAKLEEEDGLTLKSGIEKLVNGFYRRGKKANGEDALDLYYDNGSVTPCIDKDKKMDFSSKGFKETYGEVFDFYGAHGSKTIEIDWPAREGGTNVSSKKLIQALELAYDRGQTLEFGNEVLKYLQTCSKEKRDRILDAHERCVKKQTLEKIATGYGNEKEELQKQTDDMNDLNDSKITSKEDYAKDLGKTEDEMLDKIDKGLDELNKRLEVANKGKEKLNTTLSGYELVANDPEKVVKDTAFVEMTRSEKKGGKAKAKDDLSDPTKLLQAVKVQSSGSKAERDETVKALNDLTKDLMERRAALEEKMTELKGKLQGPGADDKGKDQRKKLQALEEKYQRLDEKVKDTQAKADELKGRNDKLPITIHNKEKEMETKQQQKALKT